MKTGRPVSNDPNKLHKFTLTSKTKRAMPTDQIKCRKGGKVHLTVSIPPYLREELRQEAIKRGMSMNAVTVECLEAGAGLIKDNELDHGSFSKSKGYSLYSRLKEIVTALGAELGEHDDDKLLVIPTPDNMEEFKTKWNDPITRRSRDLLHFDGPDKQGHNELHSQVGLRPGPPPSSLKDH